MSSDEEDVIAYDEEYHSSDEEDDDEDVSYRELSYLPLKPDHEQRALWVCPNGHIFLETFSPYYKLAYDFLIAIAEPRSRPALIHEYALTPYSLYAAISVGLQTEDIIRTLDRLSKTKTPKEIVNWIRRCTESVGKVKLVLQDSRFFLECATHEELQTLLQDDVIRAARVRGEAVPQQVAGGGGNDKGKEGEGVGQVTDDLAERLDQTRSLLSFEVNQGSVEAVRRRCIELDLPTIEEYDFRRDARNANLEIDLKASTGLRDYQEISLAKMFGNGRARSGIIVLPCGAGKTLVGVTAACTIKKHTLVLCTSAVSVEQWRHQFKLWSTATDKMISRFTSYSKDEVELLPITITTYSMVAFSGRRSKESLAMMQKLEAREWGLVLLDEVHVVPANIFRKVTSMIAVHCKLGLTATLVREDQRITDLNYLIGPKLYEANWLDLVRNGHIANVLCAEVWCPMSTEFYRAYLKSTPSQRALLWSMNPNKIRMCEFLVKYHEARGDKVIVFSDNVFALISYAKRLGRPFIYGPTTQVERMRVLQQFQHNPNLNCVFISKISSHYGSRRQEAQRLGRILRPKARKGTTGIQTPGSAEGLGGTFNAFFYSLVSRDTQEMFFSTKRQQFLVDQGYSFKVITDIPEVNTSTELCLSNSVERQHLLSEIVSLDVGSGGQVSTGGGTYAEELENDRDDLWAVHGRQRARGDQGKGKGKGKGKGRIGGSMLHASILSGAGSGGGGRYMEYDTQSSADVDRAKKARHAIFRERYKKK